LSDSHEKYQELMHGELDGEVSNEELVALREYLAAHPEAQSVQAELKKLTAVLNQVEDIEVPDDLHESILAALPRRRPTFDISARNSRSRFRMPLIRYGYALAAGLLLGVVLTGVVFRNLSSVEKSDVYGTMTPLENTFHYVVAEQMRLAAPDLGGTVELRRSGDSEFLVFDLHGEQAVNVEVSFDGSQAGLRGFTQEPSSIRSFEAKEGIVSFRSEGKQRSMVILASDKQAEPLLNLSFYIGGKLVHHGTLGASSQTGSPK
jgi:hypothetical protein